MNDLLTRFRHSCFLLALLLPFCGKAQQNWPAAYVITTDSKNVIVLPDTNWQMLEDRDGQFTLTAFEKNSVISSRFHPNTTKEKPMDYTISTYWQRYPVKNGLDHDLKLTIAEGVCVADIYYSVIPGKWQHLHTGFLVPRSQRDGLKTISNAVLTIPKGETVYIYERGQYDFSLAKPTALVVQLNFADQVIRQAYLDNDAGEARNILSSFIGGLLLFAAVINFFFYFTVKERVYLFFGLTLLSAFLKSDAGPQYAFYQEHPVFFHYAGIPLFLSQFFFFIHTNRHFINLKLYYPRWDRFLFAISFLLVISLTASNLVFPRIKPDWVHPAYLVFSIISAVILVTMLIIMILFIHRREINSRLYVISVLPMLSWISFGQLIQFIPSPTIAAWYATYDVPVESAAIAWLLLIFSGALILRFEKLRKENSEKEIEKERFAKELEIERNELIASQKIRLEQEVEERTAELKESLMSLKNTQSQLIQSEKMASLGELTAGIAHEIQNPLNFVNNFSEVSRELLTELTEELDAGRMDEVKAISADLDQNLEKINHHGKRADFIVKGMLQHSRTSAGERQPTNVNVLADEFLKLSYHGLRAKDKLFNVELSTSFDPDLPKINVVQQDLGRVLLNLFNNAFYAVKDKQKTVGKSYQPVVAVSTQVKDNYLVIVVKDNGNGVPEAIKDKIMQPFFTTKPTGEGTGLGLSLSYDIITKGHNGKLELISTPGEGSVFLVSLPV